MLLLTVIIKTLLITHYNYKAYNAVGYGDAEGLYRWTR